MVVARSAAGKNFGTILVPEGLVEFVPEVGCVALPHCVYSSHFFFFFKLQFSASQLCCVSAACDCGVCRALISEINEVLAAEPDLAEEQLLGKLSENSATLFPTLPAGIRLQLLLDRDPHGNVQVGAYS